MWRVHRYRCKFWTVMTLHCIFACVSVWTHFVRFLCKCSLSSRSCQCLASKWTCRSFLKTLPHSPIIQRASWVLISWWKVLGCSTSEGCEQTLHCPLVVRWESQDSWCEKCWHHYLYLCIQNISYFLQTHAIWNTPFFFTWKGLLVCAFDEEDLIFLLSS